MSFFGFPYFNITSYPPFLGCGVVWRSNHRLASCLSFFHQNIHACYIFSVILVFVILPSLIKVWMQERCSYISRYHIELGTPGTETHIYNLGWSRGGMCWPTAFTFPSAPQKRGFSQVQLNSHQGPSPLQGQSQTSIRDKDRRVTDSLPPWGEGTFNVYAPIVSSKQEVFKDLCFTETYDWTALVLSDNTDGGSRDRHPNDYGERCWD